MRNIFQGTKYQLSPWEMYLYQNCLLHLILKDIENEKNIVKQQDKKIFLQKLVNTMVSDEVKMNNEWRNKENIINGFKGIEKETVRSLFMVELLFGILQLSYIKDFKKLKYDKKVMENTVREYAEVMGKNKDLVNAVLKTLKDVLFYHVDLWKKLVIFSGPVALLGISGSLAATTIGALIGQSVGLAGAAAVNYGLALLGGGPLAAGGFGMAGGTALITAMGAGSGMIAGKGALCKFLNAEGRKFIFLDTVKTQVIIKVVLLDEYNDIEKAKEIVTQQKKVLLSFSEQLKELPLRDEKNKLEIKENKAIIHILEKAIKWEEEYITSKIENIKK